MSAITMTATRRSKCSVSLNIECARHAKGAVASVTKRNTLGYRGRAWVDMIGVTSGCDGGHPGRAKILNHRGHGGSQGAENGGPVIQSNERGPSHARGSGVPNGTQHSLARLPPVELAGYGQPSLRDFFLRG